MLETLKPFAMSLLIGLVIGIERERRHREGGDTMGVRSYTLVALLGTTAASSGSPVVAAALAVIVGALVVIGYWSTNLRRASAANASPNGIDVGLTSEFAAALVFGIGYLARHDYLLAGVIGVAVVTLLYTRRFLHDFARNVLRADEIRAALTLAVFSFVIVPFLPKEPIDPWQLLSIRKLGTIIAVIAAIEFFGYVVERYGGARIGRLTAGFFGGLASSTAVFVSLPKLYKEDPRTLRHCLGAGLMANAATLCFLAAVLGVTSFDLVSFAAGPALASAGASIVLAFVVTRRSAVPGDGGGERRNPLDMRGALRLGALIFGLLALTAFGQRTLGSQAVEVVSFVGGLLELHGVSIADATLHATGQIDMRTATIAIYCAISASFLSKTVLSWVLGYGRYAVAMTAALLATYAVGVAVALAVLQSV